LIGWSDTYDSPAPDQQHDDDGDDDAHAKAGFALFLRISSKPSPESAFGFRGLFYYIHHYYGRTDT
jgi:hypothetical protein